MSLLSLGFALLLLATIVVYNVVGRTAGRGQWLVILAANVVFYVISGGVDGLVFMALTSFSTWAGALGIDRLGRQAKTLRKATKDRAEKKAIKARYKRYQRAALIGAMVVPLGILGYLKYWNVLLFNFGFADSTSSLGLVLPIGISFYTFQALTYLIDIYNEKYGVETNYAHFFTYVSYFPAITQGPINHYDEMRPQLMANNLPSAHQMKRGLLLALYGIFKMRVVSTIASMNMTAAIGSIDPGIPGFLAAYGVLMYSIEMYADFSGGIDIARGASEILGIEMSVNFRQPYFSTSLAEFWRRWHMSLGVFMRDYIFYPIAVTRPFQAMGKWATRHFGKHIGRTLPACIANIIVFLVVGLWHGAEWHYIIWGLCNGVIVALADLFQPAFAHMNKALHIRVEGLPHKVFSIVRTFIVVNFCRYFDAITDPAQSLICLRNTVTNFLPMGPRHILATAGVDGFAWFGFPGMLIFGCLCIFVVSLQEERGTDVRERMLAWNPVVKVAFWLVFGVIIASSLYRAGYSGGFVYARY